MTTSQLLIVGIAAIAVAGVLGAFVIAYRRSADGTDEWRSGVSRETRKADRSALETPVLVGAPETAEAVEEQVVEEELPEPASPAVQAVDVVRLEELSPEEAGVSRRQFFTRALGATFGAFLVLDFTILLAIGWALWDKKQEDKR